MRYCDGHMGLDDDINNSTFYKEGMNGPETN